VGARVALMSKLAAQFDHRPARHGFALATSRLLRNLGMRLMPPLARWMPKDQQRGPCAYSPDEPREFRMGRAADPWQAAETWMQCVASVFRYMPRSDYPPTQTSRTFLRNQAFGIGTIGLREAGRPSHELLALVRAGSSESSAASPRCRMASLEAYGAIVDLAPIAAISRFQPY
jgi:hypothetical protein